MRYSFRLAKLVGHTPDPRKRPGTIKQICEFSNLDRHQVAALLKNEVKYIPLDAIGKLCDYLLAKRLAKPKDLPGILFALEPENFWELIARRQWVEFCMGVRREDPNDSLDDAWVVASDSIMFGELLNGVTDFRITAPQSIDQTGEQSHIDTASQNGNGLATVIEESKADVPPLPLLPEVLKQSLVWSPGKNALDDCISMATKVQEAFWNQE